MAIIKCKMCGGDIELAADKTFGTCEFCGSTMTFPKVDDDQRAAAFNRGNHFRRIGEFDKALAVYERIVREDNTDAEAHWCCALCRFGIEYVEDPTTYEYLPTCHRASFDSFLEDVDYLAAVEYSEGITKRQYQKDAAKIAEVQRGILATSQNEEPFDVFICYKETDENGERTRDSMMAQDVYYQLTDQGYRVFFARITLEDMAGKQYEPYIFAALNSAKVMVTISTKPEHMNAVWVKNEWSRFLAMMKKDRHKILLPCYRDMDPYDMPEQLSVLQSYDMGKIGFIQDLTRGISKVLDAEKKQEVIQETVVMQQPSAVSAAPLLKRAFMFLEDGEWERADDFSEQVLNIDPECAEAYLVKLMVELQVKTRQKLGYCEFTFDENNDFQKAIRFGDENLQKELRGYIAAITERFLAKDYQLAVSSMQEALSENDYINAAEAFNQLDGYKDSEELAQKCLEEAEKAKIYDLYSAAVSAMNESKTEQHFKAAANNFSELGDYRDSEELVAKCLELAEEARLNALYERAVKAMNSAKTELQFKYAALNFEEIITYKDSQEKYNACVENIEVARKDSIYRTAIIHMTNKIKKIENFEAAIEKFREIPGWKDANLKITQCEEAIKAIIEDNEKQEQQREMDKIARFMAERKRKITAAVILAILCIIVAVVIVITKIVIPNTKYNKAAALLESGNVIEAYDTWIALDGYKDSEEKAASIFDQYKKEKIRSATIGSYVIIGSYEQDNNLGNGKEAIEWLVLDVQDGMALVVSKYALDSKQFHKIRTEITWENCSLREWLNDDFVNNAFDEEEETLILTTNLPAQKNSTNNISPGKGTQDQVFLLSEAGANQYFANTDERVCEATAYAKAQGLTVDSKQRATWWLRTPGLGQRMACYVYRDGYLDEDGSHVDTEYAVRPAMWIDLNA